MCLFSDMLSFVAESMVARWIHWRSSVGPTKTNLTKVFLLERDEMRIDPTLLNTVMFLCQKETTKAGQIEKMPKATAFLVRIEEDELTWKYLVTAKHNIYMADDPIWVRYNKRLGGFDHLKTAKDEWIFSDDWDVACMNVWGPDNIQPEIDHASIPLNCFINDDFTYSGPPLTAASSPYKVGLGDDLAFVGLFTQHYGNTRMLPIVRFGNISALPGDPIKVRLKKGDQEYPFDVTGFLAESRSWGGHSGSPVLWTATTRGREIIDEATKGPKTEFLLNGVLGLISAHFDIVQKADAKGDYANDAGRIFTPINSGIAVVTSAFAIRELLERDDI